MSQTKTTVITGASSGIGRGLVEAFADRGDTVYGLARHARRFGATLKDSRITWLDADVADEGAVRRAFAEVRSRHERIDLVVNNAGSFVPKPFIEYTDEDFAQLIGTNVRGFFNVTREALPTMKTHGGHVVSISTSLVSQPLAKVTAALPILTKGAIEAATRALAIEYAHAGVRVNAVAPGIIDTPMHPEANHGFLRTLSPAGRLGTVKEIVEAVLYLDGASFVSGEVVRVDGGAHAGTW